MSSTTFNLGILFCGIFLYTLMVMPPVSAETSKTIIIATADSVVDEDAPTSNYGQMRQLPVGWANVANTTAQERVRQAISYLRFDLHDPDNQIPSSDLTNTVTIDSAQLRLLIQTLWGPADRSLVTAHYCPDNSWSEAEITWNSRVCSDQNMLKAQDSVTVHKPALPNIYVWDVTKAVVEAIEAGHSEITFVITAFPLLDPRVLPPKNITDSETTDSLVWFWSKERKEFGIGTAPSLTVVHTTDPSDFKQNFDQIVVDLIPAIGAAFAFFVSIYYVFKHKKLDVS